MNLVALDTPKITHTSEKGHEINNKFKENLVEGTLAWHRRFWHMIHNYMKHRDNTK